MQRRPTILFFDLIICGQFIGKLNCENFPFVETIPAEETASLKSATVTRLETWKYLINRVTGKRGVFICLDRHLTGTDENL